MLHISWLMVIMKKIFCHDSRSVVKRGLKELLSIDLEGSPLILENNWKILLNPLLDVLGHSSVFARYHFNKVILFIFYRESHSNTASLCPPLVNDLTQFLQKFVSELKTVNERSKYIPIYGNFITIFVQVVLLPSFFLYVR